MEQVSSSVVIEQRKYVRWVASVARVASVTRVVSTADAATNAPMARAPAREVSALSGFVRRGYLIRRR
jgi:hypothetical protein